MKSASCNSLFSFAGAKYGVPNGHFHRAPESLARPDVRRVELNRRPAREVLRLHVVDSLVEPEGHAFEDCQAAYDEVPVFRIVRIARLVEVQEIRGVTSCSALRVQRKGG
jgi:hypothetical protein